MTEPRTHFGFEQVDASAKAARVGAVFRSVAGKYDLMNDLMSAGLHRLWKRFAVGVANVRAGERVLDVASGTGDLVRAFAALTPPDRVWQTDINEAMLKVGRDRLLDAGIVAPHTVADAENLPFAENTFDLVSVAFGLRNMTHKDRALTEMTRVLKPGGRLLVLEFSKAHPSLEKVYDTYSFKVLPMLGRLVARDEASYRYLAESIRMHPGQDELKTMMEAAGLARVGYWNLAAGVVALHRGFKS